MFTLGSLFDGAGTFPFAAEQCGIKAIWASEIEPFPIAVTTRRFPEMKHLGDITKINGADIEPVDIITFGSPCQDLSVAGKRAGLEGERSGLFMEAVRIIKEMRYKTNGKYPQYGVWENVPGAFSSNKGEDFRSVLEELCKISSSDTVIPRPPKRGGRNAWNNSGLILGDDFSVAWRVLDAQYWGVPQRRRRIFLVADFRGQRAGKILFEREGLSRNFAESRETWKGITRSLAFGSGTQSGCIHKEYGISSYHSNAMLSDNPHSGIYEADTSKTLDLNGGNPACNQGGIVLVQVHDSRGNGDGEVVPTITGDHNNRITDYTALVSCYAVGNGQMDQIGLGKIARTLDCMHDQQAIMCVSLDRAVYNQGQNARFDIGIDENGKAFTVIAKGPGAVVCCSPVEIVLRRLTPTECGRLQGMPDWWCEDVPHSDTAEYKMWGNGMALPCVLYIMEGIASELSKSLLDSILEVGT